MFLPGTDFICRRDESTVCPALYQQFAEEACAVNFPNWNGVKQPVCKEGEYCCHSYAYYREEGRFYPGTQTKCQAVGTGCPQGFQGSGSVDCGNNYPNYNLPPLPPAPQDCPADQRACVEYAVQTMTGVMDGLNTSCVGQNTPCPVHQQYFPTFSFEGIWPSKTLEPKPQDCHTDHNCCMEMPCVGVVHSRLVTVEAHYALLPSPFSSSRRGTRYGQPVV